MFTEIFCLEVLTTLTKDSCGACSVLKIDASFSFSNQLSMVHVWAHHCCAILRLASCLQEENVTTAIVVAVGTK